MKIDLKGKWKLDTADFGVLDANVPGSLLNELLNKNLIVDPFVGTNETIVREYLKKDYTYYRNFVLDNDDLKRHNYLFFDSIDTIADIYINDFLVFKNMDMHLRERVLIDNSILKIENTIRIELKSALNYVRNSSDEYQFITLGESELKSPVLRKAHYMFGWDWGPNLPDLGIYGDIYIESTDMGYLDSFRHAEVFNDNLDECKLLIKLDVVKYGDIESIVEVIGFGYSEILNSSGDSFEFNIKNPRKWYPSGYGEQALYNLKITLTNGIEKKEYSYKIGLRKIDVDDSLDEYGKRLTIYCNNIPIYLKGSDYIPMDNIIPRVTNENIYKLLKLAKDFNHNVIRVWGGGYYPTDYFYECCDELGLLVFQDLMFACALYDCNNIEFKDLIIKETNDVLKRIRHHASIMLICGNNENETAIENWNPPKIEYAKEMYVIQYHDILEPIVKNNSDFYYLESSPTSGKGRFNGSNDYNYMDMHYWDVWHGYKPFTEYKTIYPRLLSEFGCQSFTIMDTIKKYALNEEDYDIFSKVMMHHQKNRTCNDKILGYVNSLYNEPKNFESLVYLSMLSQAEGIKMCVEHLRNNRPRCHGVLYWQINDCWPGQSWSSIDYYFNLKALHYYSKKFYNESLVIINKVNDKFIVSVSNDSLIDKDYKLRCSIYKNDGSLLSTINKDINVLKESRKDVYEFDDFYDDDNRKNTLIYVELYCETLKVSDNYYIDVLPKDFELIKPNIDVEIIDEYHLKIKTDVYTKNIYIENHMDGSVLSDNYFDLINGIEKVITFDKKIDLKTLDITSLIDY